MYKSKLKKMCSFNDISINKELLYIDVDQNKIKDAVNRLKDKYLAIREVVNGILLGDIVNVELKSVMKKYNKNEQVIVGKNSFYNQLEEQLLGMKKGDTKTIEISDNEVFLKIINVKRRITPDLTDIMVKNENINGVSTINDYIKHIYDNIVASSKKNKIRDISMNLSNEVINNSDFCLEEEDISLLNAEVKQETIIAAEKRGMSLDGYIEMMRSFFSKDIPSDVDGYLHQTALVRLKTILLGENIAKKYNTNLNEESYEKHLCEMAKKQNAKVDELKKDNTYSAYLANKYILFVNIAATDYVKDNIEFEIKPMKYVGEDNTMDKHYVYKTNGKVCASEIRFDIIDGLIRNVKFNGGCKGNVSGIQNLTEGMKAEDVITRLKGVDCHDGQSCPNEFAKALEECLKGMDL